MKREREIKYRLNNEKGATLIEASIVLPVFLFFVFAIINSSLLLYKCYGAYYSTFQTLKSVSTGPRVDEDTGATIESEEKRLYTSIANNLTRFRTGINATNTTIIVRNSKGCFKLQKNGSTLIAKVINYDSTLKCTRPATTPPNSVLDIKPNSWQTMEIYVVPLNFKFRGFSLPKVKVSSSVLMYDWS